MSRLDWFLGRRGLKDKIVKLEKKLILRENQIIQAGEIVSEYKVKISKKELEISALRLQNRLLEKIPR